MHFANLPSRRAAAYPAAPAIRDDTEELDSAALLRRCESAAAVLAAHGVGEGDVVAVLLPNRVDLIVTLFAAWRLGAAATPINPVLGDAEARYQAEDAGARLVVAEAGDRVLGIPVLDPGELAAGDPGTLPPQSPRSDTELALLIYTSGTTGSPKGVMLTHANLDAMTSSFAEWFELGANDHSLLVLPLFHANGIVLGTLTPLRAGGQVTITGRFSRDRFFDDVARHRPTYFSAVPAIYALLSTLPEEVRPDASSVRFAVCGAAPMPAEAIVRFESRFGITIVEGYGLSETTTASTINPLRGIRKPGTVGLPLPGQRVAVVGEDGEPVPTGEAGEVVIAGPVVMSGYLGRPEETARTIVDGWLHTGDIGCFDEDGYLRIVDRIKDMIIRGGENVYPKEIENALYTHPEVHEAAVVGRTDEVLGEVPVAFVSLAPGGTATPEDLAAHVAGLLARYKRPEAVTILAAIPKNPVGKIDKPALRRALKERV
ncbi:acyl-CoA synthetase (AMP-forming)/AMP-acid ligase II [Microbacterium resistens]|uniref:Acyl-CoA synthetase (AMP-forming)/AMP-acid ligase II n=1 Tax=Microbacterium resistens TaxID=156977 RepID=A0ABU1SEQ0_9MICO|nr:AMP-binding protein [Microbacterium resistens]MDR6868090.1 acyl-CoA synthetase (AMP-forming)/AMP-acid ligase II [Microbacterium resistens]